MLETCPRSDEDDSVSDDDFYDEEVDEVISEENNENNSNKEHPTPLAQTSPPQNNDLNDLSRKFKCIKPSITNTKVDCDKVKKHL